MFEQSSKNYLHGHFQVEELKTSPTQTIFSGNMENIWIISIAMQ